VPGLILNPAASCGNCYLSGVLTLEVGQAQGVAIAELLLAILYAVLSLRVHRED